MKKFYKVLLIAFISFLALGANAQNNVTILFTAHNTMYDCYTQLDSVVITNISRGWTETIYYPDTVLILTCNTTNAHSIQNENAGLSDLNPNPFAGSTNFSLQVAQAGDVNIQITDINGRIVASSCENLDKGNYMYELSLQQAGIYVVSIVTADGKFSEKLINTDNAGFNTIKRMNFNTAKSTSENCLFEVGDIMNYKGYATKNNTANESLGITEVQTTSEIITLHFNMCEEFEYEIWDTALVSYVWNGIEYDESGDYDQVFTGANGCDSLVTLHLAITDMGHEWVDLGLPSGTKWATMNIGADTVTDYGNYYAWGELQPKEIYSEFNYLHTGEDLGDISGNPQYDAARANWGGSWRMPTEAEIRELLQYCTIILYNTYTGSQNNHSVNVAKVIGPNNQSIYIPLAGNWTENHNSSYQYYSSGDYITANCILRSSSTSSANANVCFAVSIYNYFNGSVGQTQTHKDIISSSKYIGIPIRPVSD